MRLILLGCLALCALPLVATHLTAVPALAATGRVALSPILSVQARGAAVVVSAFVSCPAGRYVSGGTVEVSQVVTGARVVRGSASVSPFDCRVTGRRLLVAVTPTDDFRPVTRPFRTGRAYASFRLETCTADYSRCEELLGGRTVESRVRSVTNGTFVRSDLELRLLRTGSVQGRDVTVGVTYRCPGDVYRFVRTTVHQVTRGTVAWSSGSMNLRCDGRKRTARVSVEPFVGRLGAGVVHYAVTSGVCDEECPEDTPVLWTSALVRRAS